VYLTGEVNAFVAQRGGILGIGSRRVMGLGLTLMRVLTVSQLRAVLAHEFGHYYSGDTRLGPVVYSMRGAIFRTVVNLASHDSVVQLLHKPFGWYGSGALRISQGVSRSQEHAADQLAARTVGAKPLADGLREIHRAAVAYIPFLKDEFGPILSHGARPPFADGFAQFLAKPHVATAVGSALEREIAEGHETPYDSHPPLRERLAQLESFAAGKEEPPENDAPAVSLLRNLDTLEAELLVGMTGNAKIKTFRAASWQDVRQEVYLPAWQKLIAEHADTLRGIRPADFSQLSDDLVSFGRKFAPRNELPPIDALKQRCAEILGSALAYSLYQHGWTLLPETEDFCKFQRDAWTIDPFAVAPSIANGEFKKEEWDLQCREMGIANWDLGAVEKPGD
jgi:heat shock protein HtpX